MRSMDPQIFISLSSQICESSNLHIQIYVSSDLHTSASMDPQILNCRSTDPSISTSLGPQIRKGGGFICRWWAVYTRIWGFLNQEVPVSEDPWICGAVDVGIQEYVHLDPRIQGCRDMKFHGSVHLPPIDVEILEIEDLQIISTSMYPQTVRSSYLYIHRLTYFHIHRYTRNIHREKHSAKS